ncbi:MAG: putative dehydrogenase [Candidatus Latescibacterota bacterium]|jgi:predicted dehydrogenase
MPKTYRVGIVGCGSIARSHASGYLRVDNVQMVAAADPHPFAREYFCEEFGVQNAYASLEEMCQKEKLDIVSVCVWHLLHPDCTIDVSNLGVPGIICEKPMAVGLGEAERMLEACEKNGTKLVVSHQRRFTPGWETARKLIQDGAIGKPVMGTIQVAAGLLNWATHAIDGIRFVMNDPRTEWVMGALERQTDRYERDTATEDCCIGLVTFDTGAQVLIQSDLNRPNEGAGYFQIRGTDGIMEITERSVRLFNSTSNGWVDVPIDPNDERQAIGGETNAAQVRELIAWLEGGEEHRSSGRKARDTVEIMMAMFESARQNRVIYMPLEEKAYPLDLMIAEGKLPLSKPGRNDIRAFLNPEGMDEAEYKRLRAEGVGHSGAMRQLYEKRE